MAFPTIKTKEDARRRIESNPAVAKDYVGRLDGDRGRARDVMVDYPRGKGNQERRQIVRALAYLGIIKRWRKGEPPSEWMKPVRHTKKGEVFYSYNPDAPPDEVTWLNGLS